MAPPSRARPAAVATRPHAMAVPPGAVRLPGDATFRQGRKPSAWHMTLAVVLADAGGTQHDGSSARPRGYWRGRKPDNPHGQAAAVLAGTVRSTTERTALTVVLAEPTRASPSRAAWTRRILTLPGRRPGHQPPGGSHS